MNLYVVDFEPTAADLGAPPTGLEGLLGQGPRGPKPVFVVAPDLVSAAARVETDFPNRPVLALSVMRAEAVLIP